MGQKLIPDDIFKSHSKIPGKVKFDAIKTSGDGNCLYLYKAYESSQSKKLRDIVLGKLIIVRQCRVHATCDYNSIRKIYRDEIFLVIIMFCFA